MRGFEFTRQFIHLFPNCLVLVNPDFAQRQAVLFCPVAWSRRLALLGAFTTMTEF
jgi:hypothetical protein